MNTGAGGQKLVPFFLRQLLFNLWPGDPTHQSGRGEAAALYAHHQLAGTVSVETVSQSR